jgi:regulator of nucleoside diphosphate kinase
MKETEMRHNITITSEDRRLLSTMLESAQTHGSERREYLRVLEAELERAHEADSTEVPPDVVTMDSTVELRDLDTEEIETYTVVYPNCANVALNRVSVLAPIGTAILGCRVGDVIRVRVPSGHRRIRIEEIRFQPERASH